MAEQANFTEGFKISQTEADFFAAIHAAVDYRGDVTLKMEGGEEVEGFLYNVNPHTDSIDLFPKNAPQKISVEAKKIQEIFFSGKDEAAGKSWEDWVKKREELKRRDQSKPN